MSAIYVLTIALLNLFQGEVAAQMLPPHGAPPIPYISNEDDDLGVLLAILLLAGRNRGGDCGCCHCCNCGKTAQNIPIPFPIPFPTNNPIVTRTSEFAAGDADEERPRVKNKRREENNIYIDVVDTTSDEN